MIINVLAQSPTCLYDHGRARTIINELDDHRTIIDELDGLDGFDGHIKKLDDSHTSSTNAARAR
jgi:hypothetical protein